MIPINPLVQDHARAVLQSLPLSDEDRAALWEAYHEASNADVLAQALVRLPAHIADPLVAAKRISTPKGAAIPAHHERAMAPVLAAITHLSKIEPHVLHIAETHPAVLKHLAQTVLDSKSAEDVK